ncbi:DUF4124 domain-containing protein [Pseudomonas sp. GD03842]|uniref:DUF4124 domain-containing protein n=1 Tax=Pseudomonas sp. GD03842 TaxID=2975385 RepID=UPI0024494EBF|nr:DUF4124 domain-containing protein [Pseudomonas sp. GD03842]MDH0747235.1 DUF4124 domain-containing protein [Pseudomonas sp. GD03842]
MSASLEVSWARVALLCLLITLTQTAVADVYTYIDAEGNRVFTDQPHKNAKKVPIAPSNEIRSTPKKPSQTSSTRPKPGPLFHYQLVRILAPEPDSTLRDMQGNLIVTVTNDPALQPGHTYRLLLDNQVYAEGGRSPVFPMTNIDRGTHQLSIEIVDEFGRVAERTPNQPFHLMRISLAQKRLAQPCKVDDYGVRPECPLKDKPPEESSILPFFR